MDKVTLLKITEDYVRSLFINKEPGHDFLHIQRVRKLALKIGNSVQNDTFLVEMVALLHDVEDHKLEDGHKVKDFLDTIDIEESHKEKILFILPRLSFSKYPLLPNDFPIEGKIVSDADRLDAIGAIGVARAFSYGGNRNRRMYGSEDSSIKHFDEKLLILDQYFYLDETKRIAEKRMEFLKEFYKEFIDEINEE
ncbi:MAG: HD domain-containing protein [Bacilli bacterium]|nr:HD domain-containing protein [Bacilli bacterium]